MIKLVAFDWNGTIFADTNAVVRSETAILKYYGMKPTSVREFREYYDIPISKYWVNMRLNLNEYHREARKIEEIFVKAYEPQESLCRTRSGSREILNWLKKNKIPAIIFSNHTLPHIQKQLKRLGIFALFDAILARELGDISHMHQRSKDTKLASYVKNLKLMPKEVLAIGDTTEEIEIGKKFGYFTVALTGGYQSTRRLVAAKPDFIIHNLKQVVPIINNFKS
ncbi:MAG: HAD family hydrolase [Candidatus Doudnabacteria bacterium]|nr:HAD family hydrolase [Candidatus Doudnabacteria bacterium]